jgi:hypothetical protein
MAWPEVQGGDPGVGIVASEDPGADRLCPDDRAAPVVAAAAWSFARFCLIRLDTSRESGRDPRTRAGRRRHAGNSPRRLAEQRR